MTWDRWLVLVLIVVNLGLIARNTWLMYRLQRTIGGADGHMAGCGIYGRVLRVLGLGVLVGDAQMTVTPEQVRQLRSLNLRDPVVQMALAGFLSEQFATFEVVVHHAIVRFVEDIESRRLEKAVAVHNEAQFRGVKR
jgi:hypothetical protein